MGKTGAKDEHRKGMIPINKGSPESDVTITWSEEVKDDDILLTRIELNNNEVINGLVLCKGRGSIVEKLKFKAPKSNFSSAHIIVLKKTGKAILDSNKFKSKKSLKMTREDLMLKIKELNEPVDVKDIDFRIQSVTKSGLAIILAYKDARYDMNMLDEKIGPQNWCRDHKKIDGDLYCGIGIRVPADMQNGVILSPAEWVWKWDVGTESQTEATKGQASDSFKRAGFNWGIGRELYDFPFICIQLGSDEFTTKQVGNRTIGQATFKFKIKNLKWEIQRDSDNNITSLVANQGAKIRYNHSSSIKEAAKKTAPPKNTAPPTQKTAAEPAKQAAATPPAQKSTSNESGTANKPEEAPDQATIIASAIKKIKACKTDATLDKYWTKDFVSLQKVHDFKLAIAVKYAQLSKDKDILTDIWTKKFRDLQKIHEFKNAVIKRNGEL